MERVEKGQEHGGGSVPVPRRLGFHQLGRNRRGRDSPLSSVDFVGVFDQSSSGCRMDSVFGFRLSGLSGLGGC